MKIIAQINKASRNLLGVLGRPSVIGIGSGLLANRLLPNMASETTLPTGETSVSGAWRKPAAAVTAGVLAAGSVEVGFHVFGQDAELDVELAAAELQRLSKLAETNEDVRAALAAKGIHIAAAPQVEKKEAAAK